MTNINNIINKVAVVTTRYDGLGNEKTDDKYIGRAYKQMVKLVAEVPNMSGFYVANFFVPEYIE